MNKGLACVKSKTKNRLPSPKPRTKNSAPNFHKTLMQKVGEYPQIAYRPKKGIQKITEILLTCLIALKVLEPDILQSFRKTIQGIIDQKIDYHLRHMHKNPEFRQKSIQVLQKIHQCCMRVIERGETCLSQTLEALFFCEDSEIGEEGRTKIQTNKIEKALIYIMQIISNLGQAQEDDYSSESVENQSQRGSSSSQLSVTSIGVQFNEMDLEDNGFEQVQQQKKEINVVEMKQDELMDYIQDQKLIETVLISQGHETVSRLGDFFERKQIEEIKNILLLCKRTTTNLLPAIKQAGI